ncbi:hypothetical protein CBW65_23675 [Tumebacillus avium]|uniref:Uncharacterized protein n=1 Tax=Tumebacillus avium TaxID=1903704 RepID=A0A1Y0IW22_9BACL|nr:hypothetical protein [Tumebacillus avium]ARU63685.1 hypothetical protein CBW65_23675 [Tumebacillus avium]
MADNITISRNRFDVAMELTNLYFSTKTPKSPEEIKEIFTDFFMTVSSISVVSTSNLPHFLPDDVKKKLGR